jgi:hypothetical protein
MRANAKWSAAAILGASILVFAPAAWASDCGNEVVPGSEVDIAGFDRPESAFWDEGSQAFYVSNIGPLVPPATDAAAARDGNGYLSKLVPGQPHQQYWVGGPGAPASAVFNSPKGIRAHGGRLYVADIDEVVAVDIEGAVVERRIVVPGAVVLNDPAVHDNDLYVSDFRRLTVWRIHLKGDPDPRVFVGPSILSFYGQPNGVFIRGRRLWVGTIPTAPPAAPASGGYLLEFDLRTGARLSVHGNGALGRIDGLEGDGPTFLLTDNSGATTTTPSRLLRYDPRSALTTEILASQRRYGSLYTRYADIGFRSDDCTVVIPHLESGISKTDPSNFVTILNLVGPN